MIKFIFTLVISFLIFLLIGDELTTVLQWFVDSTTNFMAAFTLIFTILSAITTPLIEYNFIRIILTACVMFFIIDYVVKLLSGHHLVEDEEEEFLKNEVNSYQLSKKDNIKLNKTANYYANKKWKRDNKRNIELAQDSSWLEGD